MPSQKQKAPLPASQWLKKQPKDIIIVHDLGKNNSIISEAANLVYGEKAKEYGEAVDNHKRIADIANAIKDIDDPNIYTADRIAMVLTALKLARIQGPGPLKRDSFVDLIGYTDIRWRIKSTNNDRDAMNIHSPEDKPWNLGKPDQE